MPQETRLQYMNVTHIAFISSKLIHSSCYTRVCAVQCTCVTSQTLARAHAQFVVWAEP